MGYKIILIFLFIIFSKTTLHAQEYKNHIPAKPEKIKFNSFGLGIQTLGLSEFNNVFTSLNLKAIPSTRPAFYYSRMSYPVGTKVYTGFSVVSQNYIVVNETPGELTYTFAKQNLDFNVGVFVFENDLLQVPLYGGAGFSFLIFNSHSNFNNDGKDFKDVLLNGSGTGIFNLSEISINGSLISGFDIKTDYFRKSNTSQNRGLNIGIRTGISMAAFQLSPGIPGVTGVPNTDRLNYFISLNVVKYVFPCQ